MRGCDLFEVKGDNIAREDSHVSKQRRRGIQLASVDGHCLCSRHFSGWRSAEGSGYAPGSSVRAYDPGGNRPPGSWRALAFGPALTGYPSRDGRNAADNRLHAGCCRVPDALRERGATPYDVRDKAREILCDLSLRLPE